MKDMKIKFDCLFIIVYLTCIIGMSSSIIISDSTKADKEYDSYNYLSNESNENHEIVKEININKAKTENLINFSKTQEILINTDSNKYTEDKAYVDINKSYFGSISIKLSRSDTYTTNPIYLKRYGDKNRKLNREYFNESILPCTVFMGFIKNKYYDISIKDCFDFFSKNEYGHKNMILLTTRDDYHQYINIINSKKKINNFFGVLLYNQAITAAEFDNIKDNERPYFLIDEYNLNDVYDLISKLTLGYYSKNASIDINDNMASLMSSKDKLVEELIYKRERENIINDSNDVDNYEYSEFLINYDLKKCYHDECILFYMQLIITILLFLIYIGILISIFTCNGEYYKISNNSYLLLFLFAKFSISLILINNLILEPTAHPIKNFDFEIYYFVFFVNMIYKGLLVFNTWYIITVSFLIIPYSFNIYSLCILFLLLL